MNNYYFLEVLEKDVNNTESSAIAKLRKLYRSCMATGNS